MAGVVVPSAGLLVAMTVFCVARLIYRIPIPIERLLIFPMALVPNLWGVWNMLYILLQSRRHLPIGLHGAVLPFLLAPVAFAVSTLLDIRFMTRLEVFAAAVPFAVVVYYLVWKHVVGFFNELLGIA
jgi:hypothetical protein